MTNKLTEIIFNYINILDKNTLRTNLNGTPFLKEFLTIASLRYIVNKKYISSIEGYLIQGQEYFLLKKAYDLPNDAKIVEIGSFKGKSTACLALGCLGSKKRITAIDTFKGNDSDFYNFKSGKKYSKGFLSIFKKNLTKKNLLKYVDIIQGNSLEVAKDWSGQIDMLFIDASHEYKDVIKDFKNFFPFVKKGGLIMFHDVVPEFSGVMRVWNVAKKKLKKPNNFLSFGYGYK